MSQPIKFTEDELKQITELRDQSQEKVIEFGQLKIDVMLTKQRLDNLAKAEEEAELNYKALQEKEVELVNTFKEKYGVGTVDLASGEFVPAK